MKDDLNLILIVDICFEMKEKRSKNYLKKRIQNSFSFQQFLPYAFLSLLELKKKYIKINDNMKSKRVKKHQTRLQNKLNLSVRQRNCSREAGSARHDLVNIDQNSILFGVI
ncbi:hypothetical protein BpHYR1_007145 [Brachionus plicatilis]|uniref:Uncharacterized protein n=1 Tax=Brachionus plicatilis TaxID=10195 RepID=A0A3M7SPP8_BRAPC|nr:hypothetical protein BpHYR1_007145 [Brachionus plicatilis]